MNDCYASVTCIRLRREARILQNQQSIGQTLATNNHTVSRDLIADAIAAPIDWGVLERLAHDILVADDFPTLRQIGGRGDHGMDSVEESFYNAEKKVVTVVQVTSDKAQRAKVKNTLTKLEKYGIAPKKLVFLTRHPVSAEIRREMNAAADDEGITLDVRDASYLVGQLSKPPCVLYQRYFGTTASQLDAIFDRPDPLHAANGRLQHALLATLGAYVLSPHARLARSTLFDKTVLASLAAQDGKSTRRQLIASVQALMPGETVDQHRFDASITRLTANGECEMEGDAIACSAPTLEKCLHATKAAENGFKNLLNHIVSACRDLKLDDAQHGYLERNLRRAILQLLRATGPLKEEDDGQIAMAQETPDEVLTLLHKDLPPETARVSVVAFSAFIADPASASTLAPLVRSYAALAIRNIDPAGRRWQQVALARSCIALDTDAILFVLIEELPEHRAITSSLASLQHEGVELLVSDHVINEAISHLSRASKTFHRFADRLLRFPPTTVDNHVWHAVVRGYYYAKRAGYANEFKSYCNKYFNEAEPRQYVEYLLSKRLALKNERLDEAPNGALDDLYAIQTAVLQYREKSRRKAVFRDPAEMANRVREDVCMALTLAARASSSVGAAARGYVASSDRAFRTMENHEAWKPRQPVHMWTLALHELAAFTCGASASDDESVKILFSPVTAAAADLMNADIGKLTAIGVDLKDIPLDRLDWDLRHKLRGELDSMESAVVSAETDADPASANAVLSVLRTVVDQGYPVVAPVATLVKDFDSAKISLDAERIRREQLEEQLRALVAETRKQTTSKTRAKFNRIIDDLGISVDVDANDEP